MFDLIIKNGDVIDGSNSARIRADIGIVGDKIEHIGLLDDATGRHEIDAQGKIVCPGFIDVHTHSDGWLLREPNFISKTSQGFTTEALLADGISYAPLSQQTAREWMYYMHALNGLQFEHYEGWKSVAEYMELFNGRTSQNVIPHVPYANVRTLACGFGRMGPDDVQMNHIVYEIEKGMDAGAVGLSTGLDYLSLIHI